MNPLFLLLLVHFSQLLTYSQQYGTELKNKMDASVKKKKKKSIPKWFREDLQYPPAKSKKCLGYFCSTSGCFSTCKGPTWASVLFRLCFSITHEVFLSSEPQRTVNNQTFILLTVANYQRRLPQGTKLQI